MEVQGETGLRAVEEEVVSLREESRPEGQEETAAVWPQQKREVTEEAAAGQQGNSRTAAGSDQESATTPVLRLPHRPGQLDLGNIEEELEVEPATSQPSSPASLAQEPGDASWVLLGKENILEKVFGGLDLASLARACLVCRAWRLEGERRAHWANLTLTVTTGRLAALQGMAGLPRRLQALRVHSQFMSDLLCQAMAAMAARRPLRSVELFGHGGAGPPVSPATLAAALRGVHELDLDRHVTTEQAAALVTAWTEGTAPARLHIGIWAMGFLALPTDQAVRALRRVSRLSVDTADRCPELTAGLCQAIDEGSAVTELDIYGGDFSLVGQTVLQAAVARLRVARLRGLGREAARGLLELVAGGGRGELEVLNIRGRQRQDKGLDEGLVARAAARIGTLLV